jgi:hypothetical protein
MQGGRRRNELCTKQWHVLQYLENLKEWTMTTNEKFTVKGSQLVEKVRQLIHEGNIRRIRVLQQDRVVMEIPLTAGAVAIVFAPLLAALGAFAALVTECTIEVEKIEEPKK